MGDTTVSFGSNIFGFIAGGFSLFALLITVCRSHLPSYKIKDLETLPDETEKIFNGAVEEGLLTEVEVIHKIQNRLDQMKHHMSGLRARAYSATTLWQDYTELFRGTSMAIGFGCQSLKILRAQVIMSSEDGRRKLPEAHRAPDVVDTIGLELPSTSNPDDSIPSNIPNQADIVRPSSCPPAIPIQDALPQNSGPLTMTFTEQGKLAVGEVVVAAGTS